VSEYCRENPKHSRPKSEKHDLEKSEKTCFGDYVKQKHSTAFWLDISRLISKLLCFGTLIIDSYLRNGQTECHHITSNNS